MDLNMPVLDGFQVIYLDFMSYQTISKLRKMETDGEIDLT